VHPSKDYCEFCESRLLTISFNRNNIPAVLNGNPDYTACIYCDELLAEMAEEAYVLQDIYWRL
jgi:hypothetical protein